MFNINEERSPIISPGIVVDNYKESYAVCCYICGHERGLQLPALSSLHCVSMINEVGIQNKRNTRLSVKHIFLGSAVQGRGGGTLLCHVS